MAEKRAEDAAAESSSDPASASEVLRRKRRDASHTSAKERLDNQIYYLINELPDKIEAAKAAVENDIQVSNLLSLSQGYAILTASQLDILEDVVNNNRTFTNFAGTMESEGLVGSPGAGSIIVSDGAIADVLYDYGFLGLFGLGFGLPLVLGLPDYILGCDSSDFNSLVETYGLSHGVGSYLPAHDDSLTASLASRVAEFELLSATKISCILGAEDDSLEAAEVAWALEELTTALNLRLELEDAHESGGGYSS